MYDLNVYHAQPALAASSVDSNIRSSCLPSSFAYNIINIPSLTCALYTITLLFSMFAYWISVLISEIHFHKKNTSLKAYMCA